MKSIYLILLFVLVAFVLTACEGVDISKLSDDDLDRIANKAIVCNSPYIRFEMGCCIDKNDNKICDDDEGTFPIPVTPPIPETPATPDEPGHFFGNNLKDGLAYYFTYDDDFRSLIGNGFQINHETTQVAGIIGNARRGDGTQYLEQFGGLYFNGPKTLNFWLKTTDRRKDAMVFGSTFVGSGGEIMFTLNPNGQYGVAWLAIHGTFGSSYISFDGTELQDGNWHMITITKSNNVAKNFKIYIDAFQLTGYSWTEPDADLTLFPSKPFTLLARGGNYPAIATIDEFGLWNKELSQDSINQLYSNGYGLSHDEFTLERYRFYDNNLKDGLAYYFTYDDDFRSLIGNGFQINHGTTQVAGIIGNARRGDGTQYLEQVGGIDINGPKTLNFWFKTTDSGNDAMVLGTELNDNGGEMMFTLNPNGKTGNGWLAIHGTSGSSFFEFDGSELQDGNWHMITITKSNNVAKNFKIYIDAFQLTGYSWTEPDADLTLYPTKPFTLLARSGSYAIKGTIDEFGMWNKELSQDSINHLYSRGQALPHNRFK